MLPNLYTRLYPPILYYYSYVGPKGISSLGIEEQSAVVLDKKFNACLIFTFILNGPTQGHLVDVRFTHSMRKYHMYA